MKRCAICKQDKSPNEFHRCGKYRASYCKPCQSAVAKEWRSTHVRKRNKVQSTCKTCGKTWMRVVDSSRAWSGNCHRCARIAVCRTRAGKTATDPILPKVYVDVQCSDCGKQWKKRQDSLAVWLGKCRTCGNGKRNPDRELVARKERARKEMYSLIHATLKRIGHKKEGHTVDLLGYSALDLYDHLSLNLKAGMSWEKRGEWHVDHRKPVAQFIQEGVTDPKLINALSNLQPLWKHENLAKSAAFA